MTHRQRDGHRDMERDVVAQSLLPTEGEGVSQFVSPSLEGLGIVGIGMDGTARSSGSGSSSTKAAAAALIYQNPPPLCNSYAKVRN